MGEKSEREDIQKVNYLWVVRFGIISLPCPLYNE